MSKFVKKAKRYETDNEALQQVVEDDIVLDEPDVDILPELVQEPVLESPLAESEEKRENTNKMCIRDRCRHHKLFY